MSELESFLIAPWSILVIVLIIALAATWRFTVGRFHFHENEVKLRTLRLNRIERKVNESLSSAVCARNDHAKGSADLFRLRTDTHKDAGVIYSFTVLCGGLCATHSNCDPDTLRNFVVRVEILDKQRNRLIRVWFEPNSSDTALIFDFQEVNDSILAAVSRIETWKEVGN